MSRRHPHRTVRRTFASTAAAVALSAGVVLASGSTAGSRRITVTLVRDGRPETVFVEPPATVASILATVDVVPKTGRLLSIRSGRVLDEGNARPQLWMGAELVEMATAVQQGATVRLVEAPDEVEGTIEVSGDVPPPPLPDVINELWRPGVPGQGTVAKGLRSGEEVTRRTVVPPVPPARMVDREIALTFDDGPWSTTPAVLAVLKEKQVHAMFCIVGYTLNPEGVAHAKQVVAEGHSVCNHTVHHDEQLPQKPQSVIEAEILGGNDLLTDRVGTPKPTFYRPPGGSLSPAVIATAKGQGQTVIMWTVDPADYRKPPAAEIVTRVIGGLRPGAIILLHDGGGDRTQTVAAIGPIIDQARALGYVFVTPDKVGAVGTPSVAPALPTPPPPPAPTPAPIVPAG